jgi:hypothetical protein
VPQTWAGIPTFADLQGLKVEVQVRTLAQHIWAAASHKLQYKQEESVPPPLRRAIYRASALLETVDLEFERVLEEREIYIAESANKVSPAEPLNVDLLVATLEKMFPPGNRSEGETYGDLLTDLLHFKVNTVDDLVKLLEKNMGAVLEADRETAAKRLNDPAISPRTRSRAEKGLFWSHTGLARQAIKNEFGNPAWLEYFKSKREIKTTINPEPPKAEVAVKGRTSQKPAVRARKPKQAD